MKTINLYKYLITLCILLSSCYGDLEREEYKSIYPKNFYKNEADVSAATTAIYHQFRISYGYDKIYAHTNRGVNIFTEMATDVMDCQWGDGGSWEDLNLHKWTETNIRSINTYTMYKYISQMRTVILDIEAAPVTDAVKKRYIAEVRTLRAWLMFILFDLYGPVPIASDEILATPNVEVFIPRPKAEDYILQIETELKLAITDLPDQPTEWGRVSDGVAYMMLLKMYMHQKRWHEAETTARELKLPKYGYKLLDNYDDCFSLATEKNQENIWSIICDISNYWNSWVTHMLPGAYPYPNTNAEAWSGYRMPFDFYHTYDRTDKRLNNIIGEFVGKDGVLYNEQNPGAHLVKGALPFKYTVDPTQVGEKSGIDVPVFRFSDVLLSLAEAIVRQTNTPNQEAIDLIDLVRVRAGLKKLSLADYTDVNKFYDMLLLERGHELYCEGHRRSDLIRFGKFISYNLLLPNSESKPYKVLYPIPNSFIIESKGAVINNEGYK